MNDINRFIVLALASLAVTACGLATSNEERMARANEQVAAGEYRAAMIELKNVLATDAEDATARLVLAQVSLGLGDVAAAEKELLRAAELGARANAVTPLHLDILLAKGEFTEVLATLSDEDSPLTQTEQWRYRGEALLGLGNGETAAATYLEWLSVDSGSVRATIGLANAEVQQGDFESAIRRLEETKARAPENYEVWHSLGMAALRAADFDRATIALQRAADTLQSETDMLRYASILVALVESQLLRGDYENARLSLDRLMGVAPNSPVTFILAARHARSERDYALASRHLQKLLSIVPDHSSAQLFLAQMQMMQGNFAQAESLLQRVVTKSPDNLRARKLLAQVQLQQSRPRGAIEVLAPLLTDDFADSDLYTLLAYAELQQGDTQAAINNLRDAVSLAPNDFEAKLNLAGAYLDAGETSLALEVIEQVPQGAGIGLRRERLLMAALVASGDVRRADQMAQRLLSSSESRASLLVAEHYLDTERKEHAKTVLREFVSTDPSAFEAANALARIELLDGNAPKAEALYAEVVEKDSNNLRALVGLALVAEHLGDDERKMRLLEEAANAHVTAILPRVILAREHLRSNDVGSAERYANELIAIGFNNALVSEVVATVFATASRFDDALEQFTIAATLDPASPRIHLGIARVLLALDRSVDAREVLDRTLELSPYWPPALTLLALTEIRQGRLDDALETVGDFRRLHPDDVAAMTLEGEVLLRQQRFDLAAQAYRRASDAGAGQFAALREYQARVDGEEANPEVALQRWLGDSPDDALARSFLAQHYQNNGQADAAVREYQRVLESQPDNSDVLNNLAWQYQQLGQLDRAVSLAEKAVSLKGESGSYADTLGWIYRDLGRLDDSLRMLKVATQLSPGNAEIRYHYAIALHESGDSRRARSILEELKNNNASFPSRKLAEELLERL